MPVVSLSPVFNKIVLNGGAIKGDYATFIAVVLPNQNSYQMGYIAGISLPKETRVFTSFDTSVIPDSATVTRVDATWTIRRVVGTPSAWAIGFHMGTFIGGTLDVGDFFLGTALTNYNYIGSPAFQTHTTQLLPAATANSLVNLTGITDIGWKDISASPFNATRWQEFTHLATMPELTVYYDWAKPTALTTGTWTP